MTLDHIIHRYGGIFNNETERLHFINELKSVKNKYEKDSDEYKLCELICNGFPKVLIHIPIFYDTIFEKEIIGRNPKIISLLYGMRLSEDNHHDAIGFFSKNEHLFHDCKLFNYIFGLLYRKATITETQNQAIKYFKRAIDTKINTDVCSKCLTCNHNEIDSMSYRGLGTIYRIKSQKKIITPNESNIILAQFYFNQMEKKLSFNTTSDSVKADCFYSMGYFFLITSCMADEHKIKFLNEAHENFNKTIELTTDEHRRSAPLSRLAITKYLLGDRSFMKDFNMAREAGKKFNKFLVSHSKSINTGVQLTTIMCGLAIVLLSSQDDITTCSINDLMIEIGELFMGSTVSSFAERECHVNDIELFIKSLDIDNRNIQFIVKVLKNSLDFNFTSMDQQHAFYQNCLRFYHGLRQ